MGWDPEAFLLVGKWRCWGGGGQGRGRVKEEREKRRRPKDFFLLTGDQVVARRSSDLLPGQTPCSAGTGRSTRFGADKQLRPVGFTRTISYFV